VGRPPSIPKYECHVKLKTRRDGATIRNQIRLPHAVKTGTKICVICPPDSAAAKAAREAGATLVGEDEVFEVIKSGKFDFERCVAHPDSLDKMGKAGIPRILGPRGLMPNTKMGTLVQNIGGTVRSMLVGSMYRERQGKLSMAVGQLCFTPEQLKDNIQVFIAQLKRDAGDLSDLTPKEIDEVVCRSRHDPGIEAYDRQVLSSTNSPGFSLAGHFKSENSLATDMLSG
jgi:large subunit ribosomal protein L1